MKLSLTAILEPAGYQRVLWTVPSVPDFYHGLLACLDRRHSTEMQWAAALGLSEENAA